VASSGRSTRAVALAAAVGLLGCTAGLRKYPLREPMWLDQDQRPFQTEPEEYFSPFAWDAADQTIFRPITRLFAVDPAGESVNVNAVDEVADSSWFRNRIGRYPMTPAQLAQGPCRGPSLDPSLPWTITGAKPNGANPGFLIKAEDGRRYLIKFDGVIQGPRATAADVVVSRIYHAAGYYVPCNEIIFFDRSILSIAPDAMGEDEAGDEIPLGEDQIDRVFAKAMRLPDGRYRANASLFIEGKPIGPWTYQERRSDDPNDVIAHEDRREVRGARVLAAWTNHFDSREQNTLAAWMHSARGGYVRHYIIDFGDCFGSIWEPPMLGRRIGHANYLDFPEIAYDLATLGFVARPWDSARLGPSGRVFAYYDVDGFDPDAYQAGYPNPAFARVSERDLAWMTRIVARFSDAHISALVQSAQFGDLFLEQELARILRGRRDKILRRYLTRLSPLTEPQIRRKGDSPMLCLHDLAVATGVVLPSVRGYRARAWLADSATPVRPTLRAEPGQWICARLPDVAGASATDPRYLIVDLSPGIRGAEYQPPSRVHLYQLGRHDYRIVALERPYDAAPPG
jgi:hypothetical protein